MNKYKCTPSHYLHDCRSMLQSSFNSLNHTTMDSGVEPCTSALVQRIRLD